ncbi:MAG: hypothetical protein QXG39_06675 [Candidatus Aenigmatarchaeota archaeon]
MEVFGLTLQELIFSIFLPFLLFYILIYALLTKSKILGENVNKLNSMLSLVISALGIFSLYSLGLAYWLPFFAAFLAVAAFVLVYVFGVGGLAFKKIGKYKEEATGDKKKFEEGVKNCEEIWEKFKRETDLTKKAMILGEMKNEVEKLKPLAEKLGENLGKYQWYRDYEKIKV